MRNVEPSDLRWLFAAYGMGAFDNTFVGEFVGEGRDAQTFSAAMYQLAQHAAANGNGFAVVTGTRGEQSDVPIGLLYIESIGEELWPHVCWFGWARPRHKLAGWLAVLNEMSKDAAVLVRVDERDEKFFKHLKHLKALRYVGEIKHPDHKAFLYQGLERR